jgi:hypothetical protein
MAIKTWTDYPESQRKLGARGPGALKELPDLAAIAMEQIGYWSMIENRYVRLACTFLQADYEVVMRDLEETWSFPKRQKLVRNFAKANGVSDSDIELMRELELAYEPSRQMRHRFAHALWWTSPPIGRVLCTMEPKYWSLFEVTKRTGGDLTVDPAAVSVFDEQALMDERDVAKIADWNVGLLEEILDKNRTEGARNGVRGILTNVLADDARLPASKRAGIGQIVRDARALRAAANTAAAQQT